MGDEEAVLFANDRFYTAFCTRDYDAMDDLWASSGLICVHPGWQPLHGREEVMASWKAILSEDTSPQVQCRSPRVTIHGDLAFVVCIEDLNGSFLCATNVFSREDATWRMVHHQAGPVHIRAQDLPDEPDVAVN